MTTTPHDEDAPGHAGAVGHPTTDDDGHADHAHAEEPLGPLDSAAWGAGALGVVLGLVVAVCFVLATMGVG